VLATDPAGEECRRYLAARGVDKSLYATYRLGCASGSWDGLATFLKKRGANLEQVEKLGLIKRKSNGSGYFDLFRNRLLFTIANIHGQPIGFGGRVLDNSLPKYINSPESTIYLKSEVLFGIDLAKQPMRECGAAIIVEGYFDHLAIYRSGIKNVVATCGTALTRGHLQVIRRYADKLYLLFDGDSAGQKATLRGMELALAEQMPCYVIELPEGEDPDSFLAKNQTGEFSALVEKARPALEYYLRQLVSTGDTGTVEGKKVVADRFRDMLHKTADPVERELYMRELARVLGVDVRTLGKLGPSAAGAAAEKRHPRSISGVAESLVALLFRYPEICGEFRDRGAESLLPFELRTVATGIVQAVEAGDKPDCTAIIGASGESAHLRSLAALLIDDSHLAGIDDPSRALNDLCRSLERDVLRSSDAKSLREELLRLDSDSPRYWEILEALNGLRNKKSQLS
jgi:DNA primase